MARTPIAFDFWYQPVFQNDDGSLYCDGITGPTIADSLWDKVFFSGAPTPGVAEVNFRRDRDVDIKKPTGSDGATVTIHGIVPADIEIKLLIWTPDQFKALGELWPLLMTPPYKTVKQVVSGPEQFAATFGPGSFDTTTVNISGGAIQSSTTIPSAITTSTKKTVMKKVATTFDVSHPKLAKHFIKAVQIIGGSGPDPAPQPGARIFTIKCIEYLPKGKNLATQTDVSPLSSLYDPKPHPTPDQNLVNLGPK